MMKTLTRFFFCFLECFSWYLFCRLPDYWRKQEVQVDFCVWTIVVRADKLCWFCWFVNSALWVLCKVGGACYWLRAVFWRVQMQMATVHNLEEEHVKALTSSIGVSYAACAATTGTTLVIRYTITHFTREIEFFITSWHYAEVVV